MALWLVSNDACYPNVKKVSNEGSVTPIFRVRSQRSAVRFGRVSKRFGSLAFKSSPQEKHASEIFHFGYEIATSRLTVVTRPFLLNHLLCDHAPCDDKVIIFAVLSPRPW
jgi:hypothetical protein